MNTRPNPLPLRAIGVIVMLAAAAATPRPAGAQPPAARFYGIVVNMQSDIPGMVATPINFIVNRWSTPEEQDQVLGAALEGGPKALLEVLQKLPSVATVAPVAGVGFNVPYATRSRGADGIEHILLLTDRPMSFAERWYAGRSTDYPYTLISLRVLPSGTGDGNIVVAGRISVDRFNRELVVENLDIQPLRVQSLKRER